MTTIRARDQKTLLAVALVAESEADRRRVAAIRTSAPPPHARAVMEARAEILTAIEGHAVAQGESRAWGIGQFLEAQGAARTRQDIEARRDRGEILTPREAASLAQPLVLATGFQIHLTRIAQANDRKAQPVVGRSTLYDWFKAHDDALEAWHERRVMVGYDWHRADRVWVRAFDLESDQPGQLICVARFMAQAERYVPVSFEERAQDTRSQAALRRNDDKRDRIVAERDALRLVDMTPLATASFIAPEPEPEPEPAPVMPVPVASRRRTFASDEELAAWALAHPDDMTPNQKVVLAECLARPAAREVFRVCGIDLDALRRLLRAAA